MTLKMFSLYFYQLHKSSSDSFSFYCIFRKCPNFYGNEVCNCVLPTVTDCNRLASEALGEACGHSVRHGVALLVLMELAGMRNVSGHTCASVSCLVSCLPLLRRTGGGSDSLASRQKGPPPLCYTAAKPQFCEEGVCCHHLLFCHKRQ